MAVDIARQIGATPSQVALAWVLTANAIPIIGSSRKEHFAEAMVHGEVVERIVP